MGDNAKHPDGHIADSNSNHSRRESDGFNNRAVMRNRTEDGETTTNLVPIETFAFLNTYTRSKLCINKYKRLHDQYRSQLFFPYLMSVGDANILHVTSEVPILWSTISCNFSSRYQELPRFSDWDMHSPCQPRVVCSAVLSCLKSSVPHQSS